MHTVALDDEFDFHHIIDKIGHVGVDLTLLAWIPLVAGNLKTIETVGCADIYGIAIGQKVMLSNATLVIKPKVEINLGLRTTESQHVKFDGKIFWQAVKFFDLVGVFIKKLQPFSRHTVYCCQCTRTVGSPAGRHTAGLLLQYAVLKDEVGTAREVISHRDEDFRRPLLLQTTLHRAAGLPFRRTNGLILRFADVVDSPIGHLLGFLFNFFSDVFQKLGLYRGDTHTQGEKEDKERFIHLIL